MNPRVNDAKGRTLASAVEIYRLPRIFNRESRRAILSSKFRLLKGSVDTASGNRFCQGWKSVSHMRLILGQPNLPLDNQSHEAF
jgi:hypothetical protein